MAERASILKDKSVRPVLADLVKTLAGGAQHGLTVDSQQIIFEWSRNDGAINADQHDLPFQRKENAMRFKKTAISLLVGSALGVLSGVFADGSQAQNDASVQHVLLISVDGLHQDDLAWYVTNNPGSTLARLVREGVEYTNASTPFPSDSFPGMVGQVTGGNPKTTGIYYDDAYAGICFPWGRPKQTARPHREVLRCFMPK